MRHHALQNRQTKIYLFQIRWYRLFQPIEIQTENTVCRAIRSPYLIISRLPQVTHRQNWYSMEKGSLKNVSEQKRQPCVLPHSGKYQTKISACLTNVAFILPSTKAIQKCFWSHGVRTTSSAHVSELHGNSTSGKWNLWDASSIRGYPTTSWSSGKTNAFGKSQKTEHSDTSSLTGHSNRTRGPSSIWRRDCWRCNGTDAWHYLKTGHPAFWVRRQRGFETKVAGWNLSLH